MISREEYQEYHESRFGRPDYVVKVEQQEEDCSECEYEETCRAHCNGDRFKQRYNRA